MVYFWILIRLKLFFDNIDIIIMISYILLKTIELTKIILTLNSTKSKRHSNLLFFPINIIEEEMLENHAQLHAIIRAHGGENNINKSCRLFLPDMQLRKYLPHRRDNNLIQRCIQRETFCIIIFVIKFIFISKVIANSNLVILIIIAFNQNKSYYWNEDKS